jgi:hypothetical protein
VVIAHVMPRKVHLSPRDYTTFLIQWCAACRCYWMTDLPPSILVCFSAPNMHMMQ